MKYTGEIFVFVVMCVAMPSMMLGAEPPFLSDFETLPIGAVQLGLVTAPDGKLWRTWKWQTVPKSWSAIAMPSVWEGMKERKDSNKFKFFALGSDGARWFFRREEEGNKVGLHRVDANGATREQLFSSTMSFGRRLDSSVRPTCYAERPQVLFRKDGIWIPDVGSMRWRSTKGRWKEIPFPTPKRSADKEYFTDSRASAYARDTLYSDTKGVWLVRSVKSNAKNYCSYLLYVTHDKAEIVHVTKPKEFITGIVRSGSDR